MKKRLRYTLIVLILCVVTVSIFIYNNIKTQPFTVQEKLYMLSLLWKDAYDDNGLWELVPELSWDQCYSDYVEQVIKAKTNYDFHMTLNKFMSNLQDDHAGLDFPMSISGKAWLPVTLKRIEGRYFISVVHKAAETIPLYSEVVEINDTLVDTYLEENLFGLRGVQSLGKDYDNALFRLNWYGKAGSQIKLTIKTPNGETQREELKYTPKEKDLEIVAAATIDRRNTLRTVKTYEYPNFHAYELENGLVIIQVISFTSEYKMSEDIDNFLSRNWNGATTLERSKGFIIDLRGNIGGMSKSAADLMDRFTGQREISSQTGNQKVDTILAARASNLINNRYAAYSAFTENDITGILMLNNCFNIYSNFSDDYINLWMTKATAERVKQPVIVLQDIATVSAGELAAQIARESDEILVLGTNTAGVWGMTMTHKYGEMIYSVSGFREISNEGADLTNFGVQPDIWSEFTIEDFVNSRDTALLEAMRLIDLRNNDKTAYDAYIESNRYEYEIPPVKTVDIFASSIEKLSNCGILDGVLTDGEKLLGLAQIWRRAANLYYGWEEFGGTGEWNNAFKSYIPQVLKSKTIDEYYSVLKEFMDYMKDPAAVVERPGQTTDGDLYSDRAEYTMNYSSFDVSEPDKNIYSLKIKSFEVRGFSDDFDSFLRQAGNAPKGIILDIRSVSVENGLSSYHLLKLFTENYQDSQLYYKIQYRDLIEVNNALNFISANGYENLDYQKLIIRSGNGGYVLGVKMLHNVSYTPHLFSDDASSDMTDELYTFIDSMKVKYSGPVVFLTDSKTSRTAEIIAAFASRNNRFMLIGEDTAGMPSETATFPLPEGGRFYVPYISVYFRQSGIDGLENIPVNKAGIKPGIYSIQQTDDFEADKDTVMLEALSYILGKQ